MLLQPLSSWAAILVLTQDGMSEPADDEMGRSADSKALACVAKFICRVEIASGMNPSNTAQRPSYHRLFCFPSAISAQKLAATGVQAPQPAPVEGKLGTNDADESNGTDAHRSTMVAVSLGCSVLFGRARSCAG